jgi:hypothetical protein
MRIRTTASILLLFIAATAGAANNRSAVSVLGLDTNPCTPASPCRSFSAAITATAPGGEIIALDSAGYGPFSIPGPITISGAPGVHAAITVTSGHGISISSGTTGDTVTLRNLVLIGAGGDYGIYETVGADLVIMDCLVRGFSAGGIYADDFDGRMLVEHCAVLDNPGAYGIFTDGGFVITAVTVRNCTVQGNGWGVFIGYNTNAALIDSTISNNSISGIYGQNVNSQQPATSIIVENCTIVHNVVGIYATANSGNSVTIALSQTVVAYNATGTATNVTSGSVAAINSYGNNRFAGNGTDGGPFAPVAFK